MQHQAAWMGSLRNFIASSAAYGVPAPSPSQSNAVQRRGVQKSAATFSYTPSRRSWELSFLREARGSCARIPFLRRVSAITLMDWLSAQLLSASHLSGGESRSRPPCGVRHQGVHAPAAE